MGKAKIWKWERLSSAGGDILAGQSWVLTRHNCTSGRMKHPYCIAQGNGKRHQDFSGFSFQTCCVMDGWDHLMEISRTTAD